MQPKMTLDDLRAFIAREFPQRAEAYFVEAIGPMTARVRMTPGTDDVRPGGTVSGPSLFSLADCAVYYTCLAMVGPEALTVTTNASIDFMRKTPPGRDLIADVTLLKLGRVLIVGDVAIRAEGDDRIIARATMTYSRPPVEAS